MSRELLLIGIGAGDPDWVTLEAVAAIRRLDVLFVVVKSDDLDDLVEARREVVRRHRSEPLRKVELRDPPRPWRTAPDYAAAVARWREQRLEQWDAAVASALSEGEVGGFLDAVGGGGWGPVVTTTLVGTGNDPRITIGSVNLAEFFLTFISAGVFAVLIGDQSPWTTVAGLVIGGLFAAPFAALLTAKLHTKALLALVGTVIVIVSSFNIYRALV